MSTDERPTWIAHGVVEKFHARDIERAGLVNPTHDEMLKYGLKPYERVETPKNVLCTAGITRMLNLLIGAGGQAYTNSYTRIGVGNTGNSAGTETAADTDMAGASKYYQTADSTFPSVATNVLTVKSTFPTGQGNFAWNEWGIDQGGAGSNTSNSTVVAPLLNHKIVSGGLGTKTSSSSWAFTVTITLS